VQLKVREHELDCLCCRSQETKINGQFFTEIQVNIERDKVCRILSCSGLIYVSAICPDLKKVTVVSVNCMKVCGE